MRDRFSAASPPRPKALNRKLLGSGTPGVPPPPGFPFVPPSTTPTRVAPDKRQRTFFEPSLMQPLAPSVAVVSNSLEHPPIMPAPGQFDCVVKTVALPPEADRAFVARLRSHIGLMPPEK